jgi:threonine synthase
LRDALATEGDDAPGVFLATAHPAKFREVVEPAIGEMIQLPPALADAITRPRHSERLPVDYPVLKKLLLAQSR